MHSSTSIHLSICRYSHSLSTPRHAFPLSHRQPAMDPAPPVRPQVVRGRNALVGAALVAFVGGVYAYTMRAVGGSDDIGDAVRRLEKEHATNATKAT
ncbi:unnamed protein product [Closterium sp. NIES-53]